MKNGTSLAPPLLTAYPTAGWLTPSIVPTSVLLIPSSREKVRSWDILDQADKVLWARIRHLATADVVTPSSRAASPRRAINPRLSLASSTIPRLSIPLTIAWCRTPGASTPACQGILLLAPSCPLQNHCTFPQKVHFIKDVPTHV